MTKPKAPTRTLTTVLRAIFLASQPFTIPTHAPYDESIARLRQKLTDSRMFTYVERVVPEDDDSALFEIHLLALQPEDTTKFQWRKVAIARGRVVAQPAFGDALLQGEVFHGWLDIVLSFVWIIFGGWWAVWALLAVTVNRDAAVEVPPMLCGGGLGLMLFGYGVMRLADLPAYRQQMLKELAALFEPDETPNPGADS